jgi:hypothetical protein
MRRGTAALAAAAAATIGSATIARATALVANTSNDYQYETSPSGDDTYVNGTHFEIEGSAYKYADWGLMQFTPTLPAGEGVTSVNSDLTLQLSNYASTYDSDNNVTLTFYMSTDTATTVSGSSLSYQTGNNSLSQPIVNGFDTVPGDPGTFASGSQIIEVGTATYNATAYTDTQALTYNLTLNSTLENYIKTQLNSAPPVNLIVASNETDSDMAGFYNGSNSATAPTLTFDLNTSSVTSNTSKLYAGAYSVSNTSKSVNITLGTLATIGGTPTYCVLAGATTTTTVEISNGSTVGGDNLSYSVTGGNGANANNTTPGPEPIAPGGNAFVTVGFNGADTTISAGGTPANGSVTVNNLSDYSPSQDPAVTININTTVTSLALQERYVNSAEGVLTNPSVTPNFGKVLALPSTPKTYTMPVSITTTNPVAGDYGTDALTTETLNANQAATPYVVDDPFQYPDVPVATIAANTNGLGAQTFNSNNTGTVNATVTPTISGTFGSDLNETEGTYTAFNEPNYTTFGQSTITGMGLTGESDDMRVYEQWQAYQVAAVTGSGGTTSSGGSVTLSNAASNDNIYTPTGSTTSYNNGLRAAAWVTGISFNQPAEWSQSALVADTSGSTLTTNGTTITAGSPATSTTLTFNTAHAINGTYGATMTVSLENEQDIQGTSTNDAGTVAFTLQQVMTGNASPQSGAYTLDGGTLSAPATTLTGSFSQTGGTSTFASINHSGTATGAVSISGGTATLTAGGGLSSLSSLSITGSGTLDITNNHVIIDYTAGHDPIASIAAWIASGYAGGAWTGTGITSSTAKVNFKSYGIGYADGASGVVAGLTSGQVEIKYTLLGDANLDGKVNGTDFTILATNFNQSGKVWDQGDFNYDGKVNGTDFLALASNFNQSASQSAVAGGDLAALDTFAEENGLSLTTVPEPASTGLLALGLVSALARRRRKASP